LGFLQLIIFTEGETDFFVTITKQTFPFVLFEFAHYWLFVTMLIFIITIALLAVATSKLTTEWRYSELLPKHAVKLLPPQSAPYLYHQFRIRFITRNELPYYFDFSMYLRKCVRELSINMIEIHWLVWLVIFIVFILNIGRLYIFQIYDSINMMIAYGILVNTMFIIYLKCRWIRRKLAQNEDIALDLGNVEYGKEYWQVQIDNHDGVDDDAAHEPHESLFCFCCRCQDKNEDQEEKEFIELMELANEYPNQPNQPNFQVLARNKHNKDVSLTKVPLLQLMKKKFAMKWLWFLGGSRSAHERLFWFSSKAFLRRLLQLCLIVNCGMLGIYFVYFLQKFTRGYDYGVFLHIYVIIAFIICNVLFYKIYPILIMVSFTGTLSSRRIIKKTLLKLQHIKEQISRDSRIGKKYSKDLTAAATANVAPNTNNNNHTPKNKSQYYVEEKPLIDDTDDGI